ncbi:Acyl-CoA dehydrogenase, short-chain specific [Chryseobacterium aquaeductus]|uniref:Acyl-CoA dehydrogenase, short-chain specific n=1 Tax=Chryseobacterium aquaeductus TaxID=2675056 RepID=A0A9N8MHJ5_9FLAO|nr:acyl-CoA dehydrogenase family protein [Chryseobacterium aquaeductus]CAA7331894.1 Acyl-CoA dehydrogenase, short-chain specific [Chryseobacterium potabilaquae]CAD7813122.1 Acyl-CoA dehydrogenase, short-chain specific [Chryseobacterium aquaeductus]
MAELVISAQIIGENSLSEAAETDSIDSFPKKTLAKLKSADLLTASIAKKYGGRNLGLSSGTNLALLTILKNIGRGNLVMGRVLEGHINAQILIHQFGNQKQKKLFAEDAFDGRLFGVWNTQAESGTILSKIENGKYLLNGTKTFATGTDFVTRPIVTAAKKNGDWQMCVVPLDEVMVKADSSWWNPMGMKASRSFKITFAKAEIPKINLLGSAGEYYKQPGFSGGAVRFAAIHLGAAEQLLDETKKYLTDLNRTQDPFQKMRLGQMAIAVESGNQWLNAAAVRMDRYMEQPTINEGESFVIYANMMRTAIEQICIDVMNLCQKCIGARGLNKPYHFERIIRDLSTYLRQPAPDAVLTDVGGYVLNNDLDISASEIWNLNFKK